MKVKLYKPQNRLLDEFVECFYTLRRTADEENVAYLSFPSVYAMVGLNLNASIAWVGNRQTISNVPSGAVESYLFSNFDSPGLVRYEGAADEIVIYFKPLGLNAFLEGDLRHHLQTSVVSFAPFADYQAAMSAIFASFEEDGDRLSALESYWLARFRGFRHPFLSAVVGDFLNEQSSISIAESARRGGVSRPTFNKQFDRHIGTTPSQFRKVARFRKALARHREKFRSPNLSSVSHAAEYFDQSHMIKDFKSLTRLPPKIFFSEISELENGRIIWLFL